MIDLHTHSTASDGTFTPRELVEYAKNKGITVLALTDHDTTSGLEEAEEAARKNGIIFVPGIEINVQWPTGEFHLLGLGLKETGEKLSSIISFQKEERLNRNIQMAKKLQEAGLDISFEEVKERFNTENVGRPHFAQYMLEKKLIKNRQVAFDKYFAKGRPCFVDRCGADLEESIEAITLSGGIPVIAHPLSLYVSWGKMDDTIKIIKDKGVVGLEAWHPGSRHGEAVRLEELAHRMGMFATAGSDFHGEKVRSDRHIGYTAGNRRIEEKFYYEELLPNLEKYRQNHPLIKD